MARARGYSFLEVVVAAAVLLVVVGLLVPAVTKVRAAAMRARCVNHLKQLGTGVLGYHDARGHYPPGGSAAPNPAAATPTDREAGGWTWAYALLPHVGQSPLYHAADPDAVRRGTVAVYLCAARRSGADPSGLGKIDFAVNGAADPDRPTGLFAPTGVPPLRLSDLSGGTGVVVFASKRLNVAALGASRDDDDSFATAGWGSDYEVYRTAATAPGPDVNEPGNLDPRPGFGSSHPGGVFCVGFADGTVRPLRYTIDPVVWERACLRSGTPAPPSPNEN